MFNKKKKIILNLFKKISNFKKKNFLILGPIGNYSFSVFFLKINKKYNFLPIKNINLLKFKFNNLIPFENNNGGIVKDTLNLLLNNFFFINNMLIINIKHNLYLYKKYNYFYLHIQSYKQIKKSIFFFLNKIKKKFINSNSIINKGINISNFTSKKTFIIYIKKVVLKDNFINKTKFILNNNNKIKKIILSFFSKKYFYINKMINFFYSKKNYFYEIFVFSIKYLLFIMKYLKTNNKIKIVGFYNIL
ncbi:putative prephenate dehydratase [Candidatus Carsonella ruddii HT isolate Thao2000]|uniref:Putative prephenate dehydratase n=1 Tax=Candidatus Carsonella ruddii HT isolate Thao2000 TaxID=1202539 RepID=J3Z1F9_CARRU|nr:prephenate dehydratase domain-containing protein [Candidatus Carsonella ruddii]AFP84094.1 putative prephenate dehydratase [Candidatus Carsonella ruddii HT isolate Thao2000]